MSTPDRSVTAPRFPILRTCPFGPPAEYQRMRAEAALVRMTLPSGSPIWAVTRYAEGRQVLGDPRISSNTGRPERPRGTPEEHEGFFVDLDPPEHDRLRRMVISAFSARRVATLRPAVQGIVDRAIDDMIAAGPPVDLVESFARRVAARALCELYGVPEADRDFFQDRLRRLATITSDPPDVPQVSADLRGYLRGMAERAERGSADGLVATLAVTHLPTAELTVNALTNMCFMMLLAGFEPTVNMIALGVFTLLQNPDSAAALRADPDLMPGAVEELLRFHSVLDWVAFDRLAKADVEIGGQRVRAGERLNVLVAAVNHDERVFDRPEEFDIRRPGRHLSFGLGLHQCLGQNLARTELQIAYRGLLDRLPDLRLAAAVDELPFAYGSGVYGLSAMPVTW